MYIAKVSESEYSFSFKEDEYVPLDLAVDDGEMNSIYLRYVSDYTLLELGISPGGGFLTSIKLVIAPFVSSDEFPSSPCAVESGLPQFNVLLWGDQRYIDIDQSVDVFLSSTSVFFLIDPARVANKCSEDKNISFGMADGYPCWIRLDNLTETQVQAIRMAIEGSSSSQLM